MVLVRDTRRSSHDVDERSKKHLSWFAPLFCWSAPPATSL